MVEADGSVNYSNTPPPRTKNARLVGMDSGTVSVVPSISKEEKDRLREREDQLRLSGDLNKALFWYRNYPLQPFRYLTAEQVVADGKADAVVSYIFDSRSRAVGIGA